MSVVCMAFLPPMMESHRQLSKLYPGVVGVASSMDTSPSLNPKKMLTVQL